METPELLHQDHQLHQQPNNASADLKSALQNARQALADGNAALAKGDFAAYGRAQDRLKAALAAAIAAEGRK